MGDDLWDWKPFYNKITLPSPVGEFIDHDRRIQAIVQNKIDDALWVMLHGPRLGPPSPPRFGPPLPDHHDECDQCGGHPGYRETSTLPAWPRVEFQ